MSSAQLLLGVSPFAPRGVTLVSQGPRLVGTLVSTSGKKATISAWVLFGSTGTQGILGAGSGRMWLQLYRQSNGLVTVRGENSGGTAILLGTGTYHLRSGPLWRHVLVSVDLAVGGSGRMYIDDESVGNFSTYTNTDIVYATAGVWHIGRDFAGSNPISGGVAEVWFDDTVAIDLDVTANRRKFITADFRPAYLGASGELPTGFQPKLYASVPSGPGSNLELNRGSGADFDDSASTYGFTSYAPNYPIRLIAPKLTVDAADFDGTNDYMSFSGSITGDSNGNNGCISVWVRLDGGDGTDMVLFQGKNGSREFTLLRNSSNKFQVIARSFTGALKLDVTSVTSYTAGSTWYHVLCSFELSTSALRGFYVNGVEDGQWNTYSSPSTIDYTLLDWTVGAAAAGATKFNGALAELAFWGTLGIPFDVRSARNRRLFRGDDGKPVSIGTDGGVPLAVVPTFYLHLDDGESVANFKTNRSGSSGDFTITGTLDTASSSPSD